MAEPIDNSRAITQVDLAKALEDGAISKEEVEQVWRETEWMSPQTPIEVRQTIIALKDAGHEVTGVNQVILQALLDLRAALYRDESKFAHLVGGTETIVDKLKSINRWEMLVENLSNKLDELSMTVNALLDERRRERGIDEDPPPEDDEEPDEEFPVEPEPEEEYDRKIGSNWDPNNPRKK